MRSLPVVAALTIGTGFLLGATDSPSAQPAKVEQPKFIQVKQADLDGLRADAAAWKAVVDSARRIEKDWPHDAATGELYNKRALQFKLGKMLEDAIEKHTRTPLTPN